MFQDGKFVLINVLHLVVVFIIHRYGFITFENQEDADRILKKEVSVEVRILSL